jgi:hypothetical protein
MRKTLLFFIFITVFPVVSYAESFQITFPVTLSESIDNMTGSSDSNGISIRYIGDSGFGIGVTNLNIHSSHTRVRITGLNVVDSTAKLNFRALEFSYSIGILTFGLGSSLSGLYTTTSSISSYCQKWCLS